MTTAYLALGGNIGDRAAFLDKALEYLRAEPGLRLMRASGYYETASVGGPDDAPAYLNAAVEVECSHSPRKLLALCLEIERRLGRVRGERNAPRTLDLDVLLYGGLIESDDPILPHPRLHERRFVLQPLAEIAPSAIHPILKKTVAELLAGLPEDGEQKPIRMQSPGRFQPSLHGKRAFVAGSTGGIGKVVADHLRDAGARVITHGRSEKADVRGDLRDMEAQDRIFREAWDHFQGLDIWIHNAGADMLTGEAAKWTFERKLQELLAVDLVAAMRMTRMAGEAMKNAGGGAILTIGWDQADVGMAGDSGQLFAAVKGAIHSFTKSLAKSLAPRVRVNCIAPGWIRTSWGETVSENWQERVRRESLLGRWGLPEDIARAAKFLVSDEAGYITGQVVKINGGF